MEKQADETRNQFLNWTVYQIYPRSFYDANGDGIGDINGVIEKLDHLVALGVNAIWLCPCYQSPNADNGYDVSDYRAIAPEFGTMEDWQRLRDETKKREINLIMDLVANHTSDQHDWFRQARSSRENPYHDFYIWADTPPNDWQSVFGGSAWQFNEPTQEYYLHSFAIEQPDLNWENPRVREAMCAVVDFWTDKGVDGFRCDVLDFISKDIRGGKMFQGPRLHEYIRQLFDRPKTKRLFTVGECQADEAYTLQLCGKQRGELTTAFQFDHVRLGETNKYLPLDFTFDDLRNILVKWQNFTQENDLLYTLFTDNHDQPFFLSRYGNDRALRYECATAFAALFYLLRGIPFIYQGQEFGSVNSFFDDIEQFDDVETHNYYKAHKDKISETELMQQINRGSRDNARRPMAWTKNEATMYGFTTKKPWFAPPSRADEINLETDRNSQKSVFAFYQKLLAFRKENEVIRQGDFTDMTTESGSFIYQRRYGESRAIVACNFDKEQALTMPTLFNRENFRFALGNYGEQSPSAPFRPFEVRVFLKT
ncbi:MAG: alpha-glucosidase [Clostridia bacterium]|nr:alpha-glucosidase [Clostridia bacterium]